MLLDAALPAWSGDVRAGRAAPPVGMPMAGSYARRLAEAATRLLMESYRDTGGKQ